MQTVILALFCGTACVSSASAAYILAAGPREMLNRVCFAVCVLVAAMAGSGLFVHAAQDAASALIWYRVAIAESLVYVAAATGFSFALTGALTRRAYLWAGIFAPAVALALPVVGLAAPVSLHKTWGVWLVTEVTLSAGLRTAFAVMIVLYTATCALVLATLAARAGTRGQRRQALVVLAAVLVGNGGFLVQYAAETHVAALSIAGSWVFSFLLWSVGILVATAGYRFLYRPLEDSDHDIICGMSDLLMLVNGRDTVLTANEAAGRLIGRQESSLEGDSLERLVTEYPRLSRYLEELRAGSRPEFACRFHLRRSSGDPVALDARCSAVGGERGEPRRILVVGREVRDMATLRSLRGITSRESDVIRLVHAGRSNKEIASELGMTPATVKSHLTHVFQKLGLSSRTQLIGALRAYHLEPETPAADRIVLMDE